ncbi:transcription factor bHLH96-like [Panicum miliaceum]|uniref:Transcription factor bHLH96-like n=1 Tax=Panicum miliaceum TaxID=4540 RepID=A0A3L6QAM5_PANMI|nr:transcription factor bHLH96-like [Panicum miliaceum]
MTLEALCAPSTSSDVLVYDTFNAAAAACAAASPGSFLFGNAPAMEPFPAPAAEGANRVQQQGRRKRRRRQRTVKNAEDAESQRMTHIAVERNRRRQMNEYLAVLRSLMPESYVHRSDQASIVSGAIDFVKELEQQVQSLEAQKLALQQQRGGTASERGAARAPPRDSAAASVAGEAAERPPFARFFRYPQYAWRHAPPREDGAASAGAEEASRSSAVADVEVGVVVDAHASLRVMARRRPGQLLKMVAGMQALGLAVLHLNVTAAPGGLALYTLSLKVEEGCGLTTAEDIAAAAHRVLCIIDAEAAAVAQRLLAPGAGQPDL